MTDTEAQARYEEEVEIREARRSLMDRFLKGRTLLPRRLRRRDVTMYHEDDGPVVVHHIPVIVTPYPSKWEHPIRWWKMRHLRHDIEVHRDALEGLVSAELEQKLDEAFINGFGGN